MNLRSPAALIEIFRLVVQILHATQKTKLAISLEWAEKIWKLTKKLQYTAVGLQENILKLIFTEHSENLASSELLFVNEKDFIAYQQKWVNILFYCGNKNYSRIFKIVPSALIPHNTLFFDNNTLFNVKNNLKTSDFYIPNHFRKIRFKVTQVKNEYYFPDAKKAIVSFYNDSYQLSNNYINKTLENFISYPKFIREGDVIAIDLSIYGVYHKQGTIHMKTVQTNDPETDRKDEPQVYAVTQASNIYNEKSAQGYIPSMDWELMENENIKSLSPVLPVGLEKYYNQILRWFVPFFSSNLDNLSPVFILTGSPGCGKSTLLQAISKRLGVGYNKLDCSNLIGSTQTQINANIKTIMKNLSHSSPCILNLYNFQLLSLEAEGIDSEQILLNLSQSIKSINSQYPFVIVFTCENINQLKEGYVNLALQELHISPLLEQQRESMVRWLAHRNRISINKEALSYIKTQTTSFTMTDLRKLICLAEKERIKACCEGSLDIQHVKIVLDQMSIVRKGSTTTVEWQDVGGVEAIKKEVLCSLLSSQLMSVKRTGLLLHGPPGTGKTLLARAVASQCGRAFISVKGPELLNMYVGQSEANVRQVFSRAKEAAPCIIFFDELDSLAPNRGNKSDSGGVMDRVVSQLLTEMDGLDSSGDIFILGATNRPDLIDPALLRPGRFDKLIYVGPCEDNESKLKVMTALIRNFQIEEVGLEKLIEQLPDKITGANLYAICSSAWMSAAKELIKNGQVQPGVKVIVTQKDFEKAISELDPFIKM